MLPCYRKLTFHEIKVLEINASQIDANFNNSHEAALISYNKVLHAADVPVKITCDFRCTMYM